MVRAVFNKKKVLNEIEQQSVYECETKKQFAELEKVHLVKSAEFKFLIKQIIASKSKYRLINRVIRHEIELYYAKGAFFCRVKYDYTGYFSVHFTDYLREKSISIDFFAPSPTVFFMKFYAFHDRFEKMPVGKIQKAMWKGKKERIEGMRNKVGGINPYKY